MRRQPPENVGSSPNRKSYRGVEQWLARKAHNLEVAGSNPASATCFGGRLLLIHRNLHNGESVELDF